MGQHDRLRWRCRRGLLELDLILQRVLERDLDRMTHTQRELLDRMLDEPDNDLLDWALGRAEPPDAGYDEIVALLRSA